MKYLILLFTFYIPICADEVILKNENRFLGIVEKQTEGIVYFRTKEGKAKEIKKNRYYCYNL